SGVWRGRGRRRYPAVHPDGGHRGQGPEQGRGQGLEPELRAMPHMHRRIVLAAAISAALAAPAYALPNVGQPAPAFQAVDASGKTRSLSEFAGKTVVLEWTNNGCPYVQKHYGSGNMQSLQK